MQLIKFGVLRSSLSAPEKVSIDETFRYLRAALPQYTIAVENLPVHELEQSIKARDCDFFLATGGFYRRVYHRGLRDLVTMTTPRTPDPSYGSGSVLLVAKDSPYRTLADLRGKVAAASWSGGFTGYFAPMGEVLRQGFDPDRFFARFHYAYTPMRRMLEAIEAGKADVALARACTYEELMKTDRALAERFRPIDLKDTPGVRCLHSTQMYPNWCFVSTSTATWQASRDVASALLAMPATSQGVAWAIVPDYSAIDDLYKGLRAGPYSYLRVATFGQFVRKYAWAFLLLAGLVAVMALHTWRVEQVVRRRTAELNRAMERERELQRQSERYREKFTAMQRVGTVGAMSSLLAHELNSPLAVIANCARAAERILEDEDLPEAFAAALAKCVRLIGKQCDRAAGIVEHVRSYARNRQAQPRLVDLAAVARRVASMHRLTHASSAIECRAGEPAQVLADPLELELVVHNLLKNARESALAAGKSPEIALELACEAGHAVLAVRDNGPEISDGELAERTQPLRSSKAEGLGLGVLIVQTVVEKSRGSLSVRAAHPGAVVTVRLPLAEE
ncbi:MAG: PhnD/SsuA/transferrin family substrate-binding protein [Duodenibacillus sp.]|nr:PhnD/SsuA/transferrin family substrate-binding protein [Duodenibacillus sp.]